MLYMGILSNQVNLLHLQVGITIEINIEDDLK